VITGQKELNITAKLGPSMFAFMWLGTVFSIAGWIVHFHLALVSRKEHHATRKDRKAEREREKKAGVRRRMQFPKFWRSRSTV